MAWIDLEGAVNVRDLGGLSADDGGSTVPGRLLRSENLQELSPSDVRMLVSEIGVTTIVDLRSPGEVSTEGPGPLTRVPGLRHAYHPVLAEFLDGSDAVRAALLTTALEADRQRYPGDLLCGHYLGYLENRPQEVTGALRSIATAPGAAIVHCAAGKDRTGVIIALALAIAGVGQQDIVADYMASEERIEAIVARLSRSSTYASDVASRPVHKHAPQAGAMRAFLGQLDSRYGGLDRWLAGHGFTADDMAMLRAKLTRQ